MATGDIAPTNGVANIANLVSLFKGKSGSETSSTNISPEGIQALVKQALESNQGLAAIASGQKNAGLYNSSTRQLQVNDLLARISGEAAARSSTTTKKSKQDPSLGLPDLLNIYALGKAGNMDLGSLASTGADKGMGALTAIRDYLGLAPGVALDTAGAGTGATMGAQAIEKAAGFAPETVATPAVAETSGTLAAAPGASLGAADFLAGAGYLASAVNAKRKLDKFGESDDTGGQLGTLLATVGGGVFGGPLGAIAGSQFGGTIGSSASRGAAQVEDTARSVIVGAGDTIADIFGW